MSSRRSTRPGSSTIRIGHAAVKPLQQLKKSRHGMPIRSSRTITGRGASGVWSRGRAQDARRHTSLPAHEEMIGVDREVLNDSIRADDLSKTVTNCRELRVVIGDGVRRRVPTQAAPSMDGSIRAVSRMRCQRRPRRLGRSSTSDSFSAIDMKLTDDSENVFRTNRPISLHRNTHRPLTAAMAGLMLGRGAAPRVAAAPERSNAAPPPAPSPSVL